ncbi:DUF4124 domain-containing protein [Agitococcus lubricus]|uniref:Uncharacterized protein DUF4124 n=1 Tax=Agitococcus lubricus TaxID=1077255 RepID=A0A2T5J2R4_9GAMM|nr:DUF4124 domain-containing protein [Agitococcus lubricus]PTQ90818.1 uncharacterized protein DUF4124 [Agitococcus lubricus]
MQKLDIISILLMTSAVGVWTQRDRLTALWQAYQREQQTAVTIYGWQDKNGEWHYSSTPDDKRAQAITLDSKHITPLPPLADVHANTTENQPPTTESAKPLNVLDIHGLRESVIQQQQHIRAEKEKQVLAE